jgi:uncharacterized protein (TIGR02646 family)
VIRRDRSSARAPQSLLDRGGAALAGLQAFAALGKRARGQLRFELDSGIRNDAPVRASLLTLFDGRCAYCESPLTDATLEVDTFRPEQEAMDLDGRIDDPDLYWWLAYEWSNLYPACGACREAKSSRFPVAGPRAVQAANSRRLQRERRLLLDPCEDDPEAELRFAADGTVSGVTTRGAVTVAVLALNRPELVERRRTAADELLARLGHLSDRQVRSQLASTREPYTALRRRLLLEHVGKAPATTTHRSLPARARRPVWLDQVSIRNFRSLRELDLRFPEHHSERAPWLLLLGVNGVGKSSVLQAIALCFMQERDRRRYVADAAQLVNRTAAEPEGRVVLAFNDGGSVVLRFRRGAPGFTLEGRPPELNVYAYGGTRLPPAPGAPHDDRPRLHRLHNLFDPRYPLSLAERWMASVERIPSRTFTFLASSLRLLLELDEDDRLVRSQGDLHIHRDGLVLPLSEYSDGYRSMVAFTTDLMLNLSARWDSIRTAEGLVLVDELEVHLHPTWRMTAVERLRTVFPRLRFVATTHDPLCLRGSRPGEVNVLIRDEETREVEVRQRDIPPGLTADQLLTGAWFGMATTLDPDTTELLLEHGRLLLQRPTREAMRRRAEIEAELRRRRGTFAETDDERLVRSVVAELRGDEPELTATQKSAAKRAVLERARARQDGRR